MDTAIQSALIGTAGTIIGAVIGAYIQRTRAPKPRAYVSEKSPREIWEIVTRAPLLQRDAYAHRVYVGRWAKWSGTVKHAQSAGPYFQVFVQTGDEKYGIGDVMFWYPLWSRWTLVPLNEGDRIEFEARIWRVMANHVDFRRARILTHTPAPPPSPSA